MPRWVKLWVPLTVAWALPMLALPLIPTGAEQLHAEAGPGVTPTQETEPDTVVVERVERDLKETVRLTFTLEPEPLPKLATDGLVTEVHATSGGQVAEGDALISVDGVQLRTHRGPVPFHRELSAGATGDDVVELARFLTALGYETSPGVNSRLNASMVLAIKNYQRDNGAAPDGVFQPHTTIYIPAEVRRIGKVSIGVGDRVVAGDTFTKKAARAAVAEIEPLGASPLRAADHPGPYTLEIPTPEGSLVKPLESLTFTAKQANALREELLDEGVELQTDGDGTESLQGATLALATPDVIGTTPMASLYASPSGDFCVFEVTSPEADLTSATAVSVQTATAFVGALSQTAVDAELIGRTIVREAAQLSAATTAQCGAN